MKYQDYRQDPTGIACLELAANSKASIRFGAILIANGSVIGKGWNRRATDRDRNLLPGVDYAAHAEQAAIIDALDNGCDPTGGKIYVLGEVASGPNRGCTSARRAHFFGCTKCPRFFERYAITVYIPTTTGWVPLTAQEALETAKKHRGHWTRLVDQPAVPVHKHQKTKRARLAKGKAVMAVALLAVAALALGLLALPATALATGNDYPAALHSTTYSTHKFPVARQGHRLTFPRDDAAHAGFRGEWWYYSGYVRDEDGNEYGCNLTFFQIRLTPNARPFFVAHAAITNPGNPDHPFVFDQKLALPGNPNAGANQQDFAVFVGNWQAGYAPASNSQAGASGQAQIIRAVIGNNSFALTLRPQTSPVLHGDAGWLQKGTAEGNSSYYYSYPRMAADGSLTLNGKTLRVSGEMWFDHEWGSHMLGRTVNGWHWFSIRLAGNQEIMLYLLRRNDGTWDAAHAGGTMVAADGSTRRLKLADFSVEPTGAVFVSPATGYKYPSGWRVRIPSENLVLNVKPLVKDQEMQTRRTLSIYYWEGLCQVSGTQGNKSVSGHCYTELTPPLRVFTRP